MVWSFAHVGLAAERGERAARSVAETRRTSGLAVPCARRIVEHALQHLFGLTQVERHGPSRAHHSTDLVVIGGQTIVVRAGGRPPKGCFAHKRSPWFLPIG